ncbi:MAG: hypothetical protein ACRC0A_03005, partial [Chitinophagaceae bacterium]
MGIFLLLIITLWIVMQTPMFQHWVQEIFVAEVQKKTGKVVSINYLMIDILGNIQGKNLLLQDSILRDTFLYTKSFKVDLMIFKLFSGEIPIQRIDITDAIINIRKINQQYWNYEILLSLNTTDSVSSYIQINEVNAHRLFVNIIDTNSAEHHISLLKVAYKNKKSLFSNTSTSSTLIESLNWRTAYKADTNAIDFQKIWNDII